MKRMAENAISYYTLTPDDIKNITAQGQGLFKYTPSTEFIRVLHDFKAVLRVDWTQVSADIWHILGAPFTVLYPVNKVTITDEGDLAYAYSGGSVGTKQVNPAFYESNGEYFISWNFN